MTTADWETFKQEIQWTRRGERPGNRIWGVEVLASDMWVGPPKGLTRSEAETFRSKCRLAEFRTTPVEL